MTLDLIKEAIGELPNDLKQPKGKIKILFVALLVIGIIYFFKIPLWKKTRKKYYRRFRKRYSNYRSRRRNR